MAQPWEKLSPNDSRVSIHTANLNGKTYKYILGLPAGDVKGTVFLIHGWPDMGFGWRNQVLGLVGMGLRVVVPDMMGYGGTDAPQELEFYTYKRAADDMAELARQLGAPQIILGGHDWGGAIVYRIALWYPKLVSSLFSICTPYFPPNATWISLEELTSTALPNFKYQLHLSSGEVEKHINTPTTIKKFLAGAYGARTPTGDNFFDVFQGVKFDILHETDVTSGKLLSPEELDYYTEQYCRNGLRGPLNWYRTRRLNYDEELVLAEKGTKIECPTLFVQATKDAALPPAMSRNMERFFGEGLLSRGEVDANHWALWQAGKECNALIGEFVGKQLEKGEGSKASL